MDVGATYAQQGGGKLEVCIVKIFNLITFVLTFLLAIGILSDYQP